MLRSICVALLLCVAAPAFANGKHYHPRDVHSGSETTTYVNYKKPVQAKKYGYAKKYAKKRVRSAKAIATARAKTKYAQAPRASQPLVRGGDPRPRAWCGWWARQQFGIADRSYNLARKWAQIGTPAHGPSPGVIAVWRHHVGIVTGVPGPGRIILKSGNDSRAVRERERSTRGVIAYRWPPGRAVASAGVAGDI